MASLYGRRRGASILELPSEPNLDMPKAPPNTLAMPDLDFSKQGGLVPVIAQDAGSGEVLMLAYTNPQTWELTLRTGVAHYWSRSRNKVWKKGESSGNVQRVREIRIDCDADCVLLRVEQVGEAACHTGYRSCFYRVLRGGELEVDGVKVFDPAQKYGATE
jgi:phosphoribosyl-AMP cyclohydrolase